MELIGYKSHMEAWKDMNLDLLGFLHFAPPIAERLFSRPVCTRPEEGDLPRIRFRRLISQGQPGKYTFIILSKSHVFRNGRTEPGKCNAAFAPPLDLFGGSQAQGGLQSPRMVEGWVGSQMYMAPLRKMAAQLPDLVIRGSNRKPYFPIGHVKRRKAVLNHWPG